MRTLLPLILLLVPGTAGADEYKQRDEVRLGVAAAINANDAKAFASFVGPELSISELWFDTAACKKFGTAKVKAKDYPAFVACLSPLVMDARTLLVRYGPDVIVSLDMKVADGKVLLVGLTSHPTVDTAHPEVWIDAFEKHRKAGSKVFELDDKSRAEVEAVNDTGAGFRVCVDAKGNVASTTVVFPPQNHRALAKRIAAATKDWKFEPFLVRGKPIVACATETVKI